MNLKLTIVSLLACISLSGLAQTHRSEYYAVIPFWESPIQPFKGAVPLTKEQSEQRIHLRLDYDTLNRVIQSNVMIGAHRKEFVGYSALYIDAPLIRVTYTDSMEVHTFFDHLEEPTTVMNGVFQKVYEKDRYGRNVSLRFLNEAGNPAEDYFGYVRYAWSHEPDGSVIEVRYNRADEPGPLRGGFHFMRTRITYGPDGYPNMLQNIDESGNLVNSESGAATFRYFYDRQGRFDRWEVYDKDGEAAVGPSGTSGEQNVHVGYYLKAIVFFDKDGAPAVHWSGAEKWVQTYDQYGNRTIRAFHTSDGRLMNGYGGYARIVRTWSEDGRWLLSEAFFDQEGNPFNLEQTSISKTTYVRDESGKILETKRYTYKDDEYKEVEE